jgi:hypothetical protein
MKSSKKSSINEQALRCKLYRLKFSSGLPAATRLLMSVLMGVMLSSNAAVTLAKTSLMDPGVLESVETKAGVTTQTYSDGLVVETSDNQISEKDEHSEMSATMPHDYGRVSHNGYVDDLINQLIDLAYMHGHMPNSSREQALLRHFSGYYLKMKEPDKAEPLAQRYLEMQTVLAVKGEPLAYARLNLGSAMVGVKKYKEAVPLLMSAAKFYEANDDRRAYWQVLRELGLALSQTGQTEEGLKCVEASKTLAAKYHFVESEVKPDETPSREEYAGIRPTGASIGVENF